MKFLGTCGGRFATIFQTRSTGGIYLNDDETRLAIDPGPGALVRMHQELIDPTMLDAVIVSHCHIDHSNDAAILIEAMTKGSTQKRGVVIGSSSVIRGYKKSPPVLPRYQMEKLDHVITAEPNESFSMGQLEIIATPTDHTDQTTVGYLFKTKHGTIGYVSDTAYFSEMNDIYKKCRLLIICTTRPLNARIHHHMCTEDAAQLINCCKPEMAILTHFGLKTLRLDPSYQALWIMKKTGVRTISATDSMVVEMNEEILLPK